MRYFRLMRSIELKIILQLKSIFFYSQRSHLSRVKGDVTKCIMQFCRSTEVLKC